MDNREKQIRLARQLIATGIDGELKKVIESQFPELKESEDERIWQMIGNTLQYAVLSERISETSYREMSDYLERQKEQKPVISDEAIRDGVVHFGITQYQIDNWLKKHINVVEQKPAEIDEYKIIKKHITEDSLSSEVNKRLKECGWYVTYEKPAECIFDNKELHDVVISELNKYTGDNFWKSPWAIDSTGLQYPLYFASLGAKWQKEHKSDGGSSENPNNHKEWSEEDEDNFKWFDKFFRAESILVGGRDIPQDKYLWFKSLRPQPHWKPTEEQMEALELVMDRNDKLGYLLRELHDKLKNL